MFSLFRRAGVVVPGLALDDTAPAVLQGLAEGFGARERVRLHADVATLVADPGFAQAPLILVAGEEGAAVDMVARIAAARRPGTACELAVVAEDPLVQIRLRDLDAGLGGRLLRVRPVSRTAALARNILAEQPPDRVLRLGAPADQLSVVIAGAGDALSAQLTLAALRLLQLPGITPAITLVGPGMPGLLARLRAGLAELDACGQLTATATMPELDRPPSMILAGEGAPPDAMLRRLDPSGLAPIVRPVLPSWSELGRVFRDEAADRDARAIHALHLEERRSTGAQLGDQPSQAPWEDLPERYREASRHQAGHVLPKLRWAGARVAAPGPGRVAFAWTAAELAALTAAEHARWASVARLEGWSFGPERDDAAKTSPLLVAFAALSAAMRDLDSLPVRAAARHPGGSVQRDVVVAVESAVAAPATGFTRGFRAALDRLRDAYGAGSLVLRVTQMTPLMGEVAAIAHAAGVPVQLALPQEPTHAQGEPAHAFDRIAIGAAAMALLPAAVRTLRIDRDGAVTDTVPADAH